MNQLRTRELTWASARLHSLAPRVLKIRVPFISALPEPRATTAAASGFRRLDGLAAFHLPAHSVSSEGSLVHNLQARCQ